MTPGQWTTHLGRHLSDRDNKDTDEQERYRRIKGQVKDERHGQAHLPFIKRPTPLLTIETISSWCLEQTSTRKGSTVALCHPSTVDAWSL